MIRPFHLRDVPLVRRLSQQGVLLHTESALTQTHDPMWTAVLQLLVGGDHATYVWKNKAGKAHGFVQLRHQADDPHARIVQLTIAKRGDEPDETLWFSLLDELAVEAGKQGIHSLVAEVSETGAELPILRQAGYAVYTRQDIWQLVAEPDDIEVPRLQGRESVDDWDIHLLYANTVPRFVQLVEPNPPLDRGEIWVLREAGEMAAFVHVMEGETAVWLRFFMNPNASAAADSIVTAALRRKQLTGTRPVYCCVRRYQSWLQSSLERNGFAHWASQAVMVKHTVQRIEKPLPDLSAVLEGQAIPSGPTHLVRRRPPQRVNGRNRTPVPQ